MGGGELSVFLCWHLDLSLPDNTLHSILKFQFQLSIVVYKSTQFLYITLYSIILQNLLEVSNTCFVCLGRFLHKTNYIVKLFLAQSVK